MAGDASYQELVERIDILERLLTGDLAKPDVPGVLETQRKNTDFRKSFQKLLWRVYMVIAGMAAIQIYNFVMNNVK